MKRPAELDDRERSPFFRRGLDLEAMNRDTLARAIAQRTDRDRLMLALGFCCGSVVGSFGVVLVLKLMGQ